MASSPPAPRRDWPRRILDIVGAACAALLAFTAVPIVLVVIVGNPLSGGLGHDWRPLPHAAFCVLVLAAWVAWAACCAQLLRSVVAHVRSGEVGARQGSSVLDRVAARIAFGVLALTSFGTPLSLAAGAGASTPAAHTTRVLHHRTTGPRGAAIDANGGVARWRRPRPTRCSRATRSGRSRRTSSATAGIGPRSPRSISVATLGGGSRFVDPDQLKEGWRLRLPAGSPAVHPCRRGRSHIDPPPRHRDISPSWWRSVSVPWRAPHSPDAPGANAGWAVGSAAIRFCARRCRRGRRTPPRCCNGSPGCRRSDRSRPPTATWVSSLEGRPVRPKVRAICVSPAGVTFCFTEAQADEPPAGLRPGGGRHRVARRPRRARGPRPLLPLSPDGAAHRRRRRRDLARPARGGGRPAAPRRGGSRPVACRTRRGRFVGLVGDRS